MRILDEDGNAISDPDLREGYLVESTVVKDTAAPIDNEEKFAWLDDDYETVLLYVRYTEYDLEEQRRQAAFEDELSRREAIIDSTPSHIEDVRGAVGESQEAIAELGILAAGSAATIDDIMVAVAELGAIVASGVRNG